MVGSQVFPSRSGEALSLARLHSVVGQTSNGCRRLALSLSVRICNTPQLACSLIIAPLQHCTVGQYSYIPLGQHLVPVALDMLLIVASQSLPYEVVLRPA